MAASVSSLDQDMRRLRMDRYTPQAANEVRSWIESTLGERLQSGDLLDALKDGVALCKLANLVLPPPGIKFKASSMPFTQRENISQFLTACERQPLMLPAHDRFLTVDLYDNKDPAQVLQCVGAFSRAANAAKPSAVPTAIGPKRAGGSSPTRSTVNGSNSFTGHQRGMSDASQGSDSGTDSRRAMSPALSGRSNNSNSTKTSGSQVSSWSKKTDEYTSAPAWNIHQYGYMGGASQGNQGISFGARRQITTPQVGVPSVAENERRRKEQEADAERQRREEEMAEKKRHAQQQEVERQARIREQEAWEDETRKAREKEKRQLELDRQRWEAEEKRWQEEDARRKKEQEEQESRLQSQFNAQSRADQTAKDEAKAHAENKRILELERQLEEAKERERQYQLEREERNRQNTRTPDTPEPESSDAYRRPDTVSTPSKDDNRNSWAPDERAQLRQAWTENQTAGGSPASQSLGSSRPLPNPETASSLQATPQSMRPGGGLDAPTGQPQPVPPPSASAEPPAQPPSSKPDQNPTTTSASTRPLPSPNPPLKTTNSRSSFSSPTPATNVPPPSSSSRSPFSPTSRTQPRTTFSRETGTSTSERAAEDQRRIASQEQTKKGGLASKSLLEREMERERERQREWEEGVMRRSGGPSGPRELKR